MGRLQRGCVLSPPCGRSQGVILSYIHSFPQDDFAKIPLYVPLFLLAKRTLIYPIFVFLLSTKKCTMWEFRIKFYLQQMRTAAREIAPQRALRVWSKEAVWGGQCIRFWWRGSSVRSSAYFTRGVLLVTGSWGIQCSCRYDEMQGLGSWNPFLKISFWRPVPPSFLGAWSACFSTLNSLDGVL